MLKRDSSYSFVFSFGSVFLLTYIRKLPLHFIAKVKVIKEKEEACVQCFHTCLLLFCYYFRCKCNTFLEKTSVLLNFSFLFSEISCISFFSGLGILFRKGASGTKNAATFEGKSRGV